MKTGLHREEILDGRFRQQISTADTHSASAATTLWTYSINRAKETKQNRRNTQRMRKPAPTNKTRPMVGIGDLDHESHPIYPHVTTTPVTTSARSWTTNQPKK